MKFKYDSNVHNTLEEVWDFILDFSKRPEWIHFMEKSYVTHQTKNWIGTKYKEKFVFLGIPLYIEYEITNFKEHSLIESKSKMPPFYPEVVTVVKDNGDGTIYSSLEFDIKLGAFMLVPKSIIQKQVDNIILPFIEEYKRILDKPKG
jgi:hypothetical protein